MRVVWLAAMAVVATVAGAPSVPLLAQALAAPVAPAASAPAPPPLPLPAAARPGALLDRVACAAPADCSYALYLPPGYDPARRWPTLYLFDSRRQGRELAALAQPAAARFGWVLVSALESSNLVPMEQNAALLRAIWTDTHDRLAIDPRRTYGGAFSGLVRFVVTMALAAPGTFAGVVGLNGGFPLGEQPGEAAFPFFATVGDRDFSYYELHDLAARLAAAGVPHRLEVFAGSHEWPPVELLHLAFAWLELRAMRDGTRARDEVQVEALWRERLERAATLEGAAGGDAALASWRAWRDLAADFAGLRDTSAAAERAAALAIDPAVQEAQRRNQQRLERDRRYLERAPTLLHAAAGEEEAAVSELLAALAVPALQRQAKSDPDREERLSAERVLYAVYIQSALYLPRLFNERGEHRRALFYLRVAAALDPEVPHVPYRTAVTWALLGNRREALRALAQAVELGWDDAAAASGEPAFAPLRDEPRFAELVAAMRAAARPEGNR